MKVIITGAAGSLGQCLVKKLLTNTSIKVYATDIKQNPFSDAANLQYMQADLRDVTFTEWVTTIKPRQLIHLASVLQISAQMSREQAYEIDVSATKKLLDICVSIAVEKFIITTSGAAYGYFKENENIITEHRLPRGNKDYFYSAHKAEVEAILAEFRVKNPQMQQLIFRPGSILGPNIKGPVVNLFQQKIMTGLIGYPGPFNFIWLEDVIDYIIEGINSKITGEYNIAADGILSMAEIAKKIDKFYLPLPALLMQLLLTIAKPLGLTQYGPEQIKFIKYRPVLSNEKIKACFKHQPRYTTEQALDAYQDYEKSITPHDE